MPFIGSLGGAYGYGRAASSANSGVYISRVEFIDSVIDASGNIWFTCQSITSIGNLNIGLYNKFGKLVQEVTLENGGPPTMFLVYVSADGVSSLWMRRIDGPFESGKLVLDSLKNIYITGTISANTVLTVYTAAGGSFYTQTANTYLTFYLVKYTAAGAPSWVGRSVNSVGGQYDSITLVDMKVDSLGNPVIIMSIHTSTIQNIQFGVGTSSITTFGTNIAISGIYTIIVKYNTSGSTTGAWAAYISGTVAIPCFPTAVTGYNTNPYQTNRECLVINSQNEIICTGRYTSTAGIVFDSTNAQIGPNLLMASNGGSYTFIVKFGTNGRAATSWRVGLYCYTTPTPPATALLTLLRQDNVPASIFVDSSDNIYCVGFSGSRTNTYTFAAVNTTNGLTDNVNFAITTGVCNMYIVKYSTTGTPLWASSIRGTGTLSPATSTVFNGEVDATRINTSPNNTFAGLDASGNVFVISSYRMNTVELFTGTTKRGITLTTSTTLTTPYVYDLFIARIAGDNSMGYITKLATTVTATTSDSIIPYYVLTNSSDLYLYFRSNKSSLGLYLDGNNTTPSITLSNANRKDTACVCKYNYELSSVSVGYLASSTTTVFTIIPVYMCFDLNGNVIIRGDCGAGSTSAALQLQLYNFGSSSANISQTIGTATSVSGSFMAKLTLDASNPGLIRIQIAANTNTTPLIATGAVQNSVDPTLNNSVYTMNNLRTYYYVFNSQNSRYLSYTPLINADGLFLLAVPPEDW